MRSEWPFSALPMRRLAPVRDLAVSRARHIEQCIPTFLQAQPGPLPTPARVFAAQDPSRPRWLTHARSALCAPWLLRDPLNTVEWEGAVAFATTPALPRISTSDTPCRTSLGSGRWKRSAPKGCLGSPHLRGATIRKQHLLGLAKEPQRCRLGVPSDNKHHTGV